MKNLALYLCVLLFSAQAWASSITPAGQQGQVQYNNGLYFGGTSLLTVGSSGLTIGSSTFTTPVGVNSGGTGAANASDAEHNLAFTLSPTDCSNTSFHPAWCNTPNAAGDLGAWSNNAQAYAVAQSWPYVNLIIDNTQIWALFTQITRTSNVGFYCNGASIVWQHASGVAIASGGLGNNIWRSQGVRDCNISTVGGWPNTDFSGFITATAGNDVLTVTSVATGALATGMQISVPGMLPDTSIVSEGSGTGGTGTYNLNTNNLQTIGTSTMTASNNSNVCLYTGGDPAGVITPVDAIDANDQFYNVQCTGFKYGTTHGNNSWANNFVLDKVEDDYDGVYGPIVLHATVTAYSVSSNVVTITAANSFSVGQVVNITGLSTATYLNMVPLIVATASGTQFTASFTHANASGSDSGAAFVGFYNAGEPSHIIGGNWSNHFNAGMELNSPEDQWTSDFANYDYNTLSAVLGAGPNINFNSYIEQLNGPAIYHSSASNSMILRLGNNAQIALTGTGTDNGVIQAGNTSDYVDLGSVVLNLHHTVNYVVYTNALSSIGLCGVLPHYDGGSMQAGAITDTTTNGCPVSPMTAFSNNGATPFTGWSFGFTGADFYNPGLTAGNVYAIRVGDQNRTDIGPNALFGFYHGSGGADTDKAIIGFQTAGDVQTNVVTVGTSGVTIGTGYATSTAPANGLIVQGNVGIGTTSSANSPLSIVGLGTSAPIGTSAAGSLCIDSANNVYRKAACP